ncbi:hypothetical protein M758_UG303500 [Ceratodon purpureus]|nr:hypothetical protein M758_UG303500 [Ceratodon purpureus]
MKYQGSFVSSSVVVNLTMGAGWRAGISALELLEYSPSGGTSSTRQCSRERTVNGTGSPSVTNEELRSEKVSWNSASIVNVLGNGPYDKTLILTSNQTVCCMK